MTLRIEEGKFYRRRDGEVVGPAAFSLCETDDPYVWHVGTECYTAEGAWFVGNPGDPGNFRDIVEEVPDPNAKPSAGCPAAQVDVQRDEYGPVADRAAARAAQQDLLWPLDAQQSGRAEPKFKVGDRVRGVTVRYRPLATVFAVRGNDVKVAWDGDIVNPASNSFWPETDFELIADDSAYGGPIPAPDLVDHPPHYTTGGVECFDAMSAMLSKEELIGYLRGNSFKYRWRFRHKGGVEDLRKAEWYEKKLLDLVA